jgi:hypothetical protein
VVTSTLQDVNQVGGYGDHRRRYHLGRSLRKGPVHSNKRAVTGIGNLLRALLGVSPMGPISAAWQHIGIFIMQQREQNQMKEAFP